MGSCALSFCHSLGAEKLSEENKLKKKNKKGETGQDARINSYLS